MNEHFLHFVWKNGLFSKTGLKTVSGDKLELIDPGTYNRDSGPDFLNSRIRIGDTEWAGNIEIHFKSSSWYEHKHHLDRAYNNVILHVVLNHDKITFTESGIKLDTFVVEIHPAIIQRYQEYMKDDSVVACRRDLNKTNLFFVRHWISKLAVERMEIKTDRIMELLEQTRHNWEEVLYRLIAASFGMKVNRDPFCQLAARVPLRLIRKHSDNILQVEALFYGQAGFLHPLLLNTEEPDDYRRLLCQEYSVLKSKYRLKPLDPSIWKFHRIRPVNFPTRRISQLASLFVRSNGLFSSIKEAPSYREVAGLLFAETSEYWQRHYRFGKSAPDIPSGIGKSLVKNLIINSIVPMLWLYGKIQKSDAYSDRALDILDSIQPEQNRIIKEWIRLGIVPKSSFESQGLIELTESYCKNRKCLNCHIGTKLISLGLEFDPESSLILGEPV